ncbi:c-type cytochrome [Aestuariivivens sediminicola]|uniref:c-type cytochrome n=1 Tax=Aestuariivivens sediminicola TaxID=2913560 RepID=UPI001F570B7E|nr:c-type cytochrome [Aestuariivivens sediminicola]
MPTGLLKMIINRTHMLLPVLCLLMACHDKPVPITETISINEVTLPLGFNIETLYRPGAHEQGSWVSLTKDEEGRLYASDQYGTIYRVSLPDREQHQDSVQVKRLAIQIGMAQGLLWHDEVLYAVVNAETNNEMGIQSGFYRITDTNKDDAFDTVTLLRAFDGDGEHGPHNIALAPDGESLYIVLGNHTKIPEDLGSAVPKQWGEDNLLPVIKDPSGHANDVKAPGGWVVKTDFEGKDWTIINVGLRNTYDMAFNPDGELFGFDSDMEYDMGMPWYRPIRLCHLTQGGDFGWRTGTGKFAAEYPDNLPAIVNMGQGSPTGVLYGKGLKFPEYYQDGLYLFDWSYGTMYFVSLSPNGSSYTAEITEFLSGVPLPLTNGVVGNDGALYFLTGGRRLESALYRVTYNGDLKHEVIPLKENRSGKKKRALRKTIEHLQLEKDTRKIDFLIENLNHEDRYIRFSARVALENQDMAGWRADITIQEDAMRKIAMAIAIAHQGEDSDRLLALSALIELDWTSLNTTEKTDFLRAIELLIVRMDQDMDTTFKNALSRKLLPFLFKETSGINKQLVALLSYLDLPEILEPTISKMEQDTITDQFKGMYLSSDISKRSAQYGQDVENMLKQMPNQQHISYAKSLAELKTGWTKALRERYFRWYSEAFTKKGGLQYTNFIKAIQRRALTNVPEADRAYFESLGEASMNDMEDLMKDVQAPEGPGRNWTVNEVVNAFAQNSANANFERGDNLFRATLCVACHQINGMGGSVGPELSQLGTRFTVKDIAEAIVNPSQTISDRYRDAIYYLKDGQTVTGRFIEETDQDITLSTNPFSPDITTRIGKSDLLKKEPSPLSSMPPGLINTLNEKELSDLVAFLLAGGDKGHSIYTKSP